MPRAAGGRCVTSRPPMRMVPAVGVSSPAIRRSVVDLPQPDGPSSTTKEPGSASKRDAVEGARAPPVLGDVFEFDGRHRRAVSPEMARLPAQPSADAPHDRSRRLRPRLPRGHRRHRPLRREVRAPTPRTTWSPGRSLPLYMTTATVFATWFGAETVLSVSGHLREGRPRRHPRRPVRRHLLPDLRGALLRPRLLPHGPAHHRRLLQEALRQGRWRCSPASRSRSPTWAGPRRRSPRSGIVFNSLSAGRHHASTQGILLGAAIVLVYTTLGGMWSVALTDLFQSVIIVLGPASTSRPGASAAWRAASATVIAHAAAAGKFQFWPSRRQQGVVGVRRRVGDARDRLDPAAGRVPARAPAPRTRTPRCAARCSARAPTSCFAFVPMFLAYCGAAWSTRRWSKRCSSRKAARSQLILPNFILAPHAALRAGDVLRRAALGDPVDAPRARCSRPRRSSPRTC